jgi:hypothetical protein
MHFGHPQPSSLGKHSFIRLMRMPRASKDHLTCDLGCGSLAQHSNDKYSFRQFFDFFKEIFLSFISFHINVCPKCVCMTQSNTKQLPTCLDPHIFVPSVTPFCIDMRGKSLSCCCSASLINQRYKSSNDSLSFFFELGPPIKLSRQPNMCLSKPVPLTCNISAGTDPSNPHFMSPKGTFSKALEMCFLHKFVKPSSVKCAYFNSSGVMREHISMGLERSSKRHLQS